MAHKTELGFASLPVPSDDTPVRSDETDDTRQLSPQELDLALLASRRGEGEADGRAATARQRQRISVARLEHALARREASERPHAPKGAIAPDMFTAAEACYNHAPASSESRSSRAGAPTIRGFRRWPRRPGDGLRVTFLTMALVGVVLVGLLLAAGR